MIDVTVSDGALARVRFAVSPLGEAGLSLRAVRAPGRFPRHRSWAADAAARLDADELEVLTALVDDDLRTPDFLNPAPRAALTRIDDELQGLAGLSDDELRRDLAAAHPRGLPPRLRENVPDLRHAVVRSVSRYWALCVAPRWPAVRAVLEADVTFRALETAREGLGATLRGLSPQISFDAGVLRLTVNDRRPETIGSGPEGVTLVPTLFTTRVSTRIDRSGPPTVWYPARGVATLEPTAPDRGPSTLTALVGPVRARLLGLLGEPASTTVLARRLGVSPSAVNQQLASLARAGLVTRARAGRSVLYARSELGDRLTGHPG